jgi:hypothetical protein
MILDDETYEIIQNLVKLHYDITHATAKQSKIDEAVSVYQDTITRLKKQYGIRTRTSVSSITNPLKTLRKINRDYDDDYDYGYGRRSYSIYDDDDDYYEDRRSRRRGRRRDDDFYDDDEEFITAILRGVEPVDFKRKGSKKGKRSESSRSSRRDDDYDDDDDFETVATDTFGKIADGLEKINARLDNLEAGASEDYYAPEPPVRVSRRPIVEDIEPEGSNGIRTTLDALTRSVRTIASNQARDRDDLNDVIGIIKDAFTEDEEEAEDELPPNVVGGDLLKTQGGVSNNST